MDIGNLEQYVRLSTTQELSSTDQHIKAAVNHLFRYALEQRASDIHIEPKRDACTVRYHISVLPEPVGPMSRILLLASSTSLSSLPRWRKRL